LRQFRKAKLVVQESSFQAGKKGATCLSVEKVEKLKQGPEIKE